ncbi:hypothetical protein KAH94_06150, partial [bacterium]|nr:hypothetical protein [bacterium]
MIDLGFLREHTDVTIALLKKKDPSFDVHGLVQFDRSVRTLRLEVENLRQKKNELAQQGKSGVTLELREQSKKIGSDLKDKNNQLLDVEKKFKELYLRCPNILHADVPKGNKEGNVVVKEVGKKPIFSFEPKNHLDLGTDLGWLDFESAAISTGANFAMYKGDAVRLMYSLTMLMLKNNVEHGFEPVLPPYLVNAKSLEVASNFPKFKDQVYSVTDDGLY